MLALNNMEKITPKEKERIIEIMNPQGSNWKDCNFFRTIQKVDGGKKVEVGYWITYLNCRPKYQKEIIYLPNLPEDNNQIED